VARRADPERVERLFDLVEQAIRAKAPAQADALVAILHEHLGAWRPHLLDGVNPLLPGAGAEWDAARAAAYALTVNVGAVHLELGTWTASGRTPCSSTSPTRTRCWPSATACCARAA